MSCSMPSLTYWLSDARLLVAVAINGCAQFFGPSVARADWCREAKEILGKEPDSSR